MGNLPVQESPKFTEEIPAVTREDMITAELENQIKAALLNNDVFLKQAIETLVKEAITNKGGVIKEGANLILEGGMIYIQRPDGQGENAYARGVTFLDENAKIVGGVGFHGNFNKEEPRFAYFGIGTEAPWDYRKGLSITKDDIRWQNNDISIKYSFTADLRDTTIYNENTWYPVASSDLLDVQSFTKIEIGASLGVSGKPSWATHEQGFSAHVALLNLGSGWGATKGTGILLDKTFKFISGDVCPIGYRQRTENSIPIIYLRGGGKYEIRSSNKPQWGIFKDGYETDVFTAPPVTNDPGVVLLNLATIQANLEGTAKYAEHLQVLNSNEVNFANLPASGALWINHKDISGTMGEHQSLDYRFGDGHGNTVQTAITTGKIIAGNGNTATGVNVSAFGYQNDITGYYSVGIGAGNRNRANYTLTAGYQLFNNTSAGTVLGQFNKLTAATESFLVIGNGSQESTRSNCFGVDAVGNVRATGTFNASTAADYAEFFEWRDGNLGYEDRVGHFVTLDGDKIRIANADDDYILGIISGKPAILGNSDCDSWNGMYLRDEFGREITEPKPKTELVQLTEEVDDIDPETGEVVGTKTVVTGVAEQEVFDEDGNLVYEGTRPIVNPAYNPEQLYISRADRPEWAAVGMLGVLAVYDDGSCQVNGYCQVADGGIATNDDSIERRYRVVARVTENIIKVVFR